jgi:hypothetical protein
VEEFIRQLETLERTRQGQAVLLQMSDGSEYGPSPFKIFSVDTMGSMAISAEVMLSFYIGNRSLLAANKLSVTFEVDQGLLPTIIEDFKTLFAQYRQ